MSSSTSSSSDITPPATTSLTVLPSAPPSLPDSEIMIIDSTETTKTSTLTEPTNVKPLSTKAQGKQPAEQPSKPSQARQARSVAETFMTTTPDPTPEGLFFDVREAEVLVRTQYVTTANCKKLLSQEGVRDVFLRWERDMNMQRSVNVEAILGQSRGEMEGEECVGCAGGLGLFTSCITVEGMFSGSCTNCHFGSKGAKCSFRQKTGVKRGAKEASIGEQEEEGYGRGARGARGRKRKQVDVPERFRRVGTLLSYLAEEFMDIADALEE